MARRRLLWCWACLAVSALACGKASSPVDAGPPLAPCGLSVLGECNGTVLEYCDPETEQVDTVDCSMVIPGEPFICTLVDPYDGYDCEAPAGGACEFFNTGDGSEDIFFCQGIGPSCLLSPTGASTCVTNNAPCVVLGDGGSEAPAGCVSPDGGSGASGAYLVDGCNSTQQILYDCTAAGGSCLNEHCINQEAGAPCDDGATILCAAGLNCVPTDAGTTVCGH